MKKHIILFLFWSLLLNIASAQVLTGRVVKIADGDTFTLLVNDNEQLKIRLDGIDAPEKGQPHSNRAKECLSSMIWGVPVTVNVQKKDHYGRFIGRVSTAKVKDVNLEMIKSGYAWHYKEYNKNKVYAEAESSARKAKIGLWQDKNPIRPQDFRKSRRKKK